MLRGMNKKWLLFFVILMAVTASTFAQQYHFVYIQADNQQPFYAKFNGKNYSSSSIGYLILPKLNDGDIKVQVGFPKNLYPEQTFNLTLAGKDLGYALKNFDQKGWGLFNFQTTDVVMNADAAVNETARQTATTNNNNAFGNMLANAINDSTLNRQRIAPKDTAVAKAPESMTANTDTSLNNTSLTQPDVNSNTIGANITKDSVQTVDSALTNTAKSLDITKSSENKNNSGTDLTFLDNTSKDTIHAFIPSTDTISAGKKVAADSAKGKVDNPFFNGDGNTNTTALQPMADTTNSSGTTSGSVNSSCTKMFSSYDSDKLKKKIISLNKQDDILNAVRKNLRGKCITTEQVQDLGNLFLSDENRYGFYDAAYPFVYDFGNYLQLQNSLIDTYYKNRFKALLH